MIVVAEQGHVAVVSLMIGRPSADTAVPLGKPAEWILKLTAQNLAGLQLQTPLQLAVHPGLFS